MGSSRNSRREQIFLVWFKLSQSLSIGLKRKAFSSMQLLNMVLFFLEMVKRSQRMFCMKKLKPHFQSTLRKILLNRRPFYNYYGTVFRRVGDFVYFHSGSGAVKGVNLASPQGFITCVTNSRCFDVDNHGIVSVDKDCKTISIHSPLASKSRYLINFSFWVKSYHRRRTTQLWTIGCYSNSYPQERNRGRRKWQARGCF